MEPVAEPIIWADSGLSPQVRSDQGAPLEADIHIRLDLGNTLQRRMTAQSPMRLPLRYALTVEMRRELTLQMCI